MKYLIIFLFLIISCTKTIEKRQTCMECRIPYDKYDVIAVDSSKNELGLKTYYIKVKRCSKIKPW